MHRRAFLVTVPGLAAPFAGCTSGAPGGVRDTEFQRTGDCTVDDENASVTVDGDDVRVVGCVAGPNGCAEARLASTRLDGTALDVVVEAFVPDDAEACTQALVGRSYRATVRLDDPPESVRVVHRGVGDERTVAQWP